MSEYHGKWDGFFEFGWYVFGLTDTYPRVSGALRNGFLYKNL